MSLWVKDDDPKWWQDFYHTAQDILRVFWRCESWRGRILTILMLPLLFLSFILGAIIGSVKAFWYRAKPWLHDPEEFEGIKNE